MKVSCLLASVVCVASQDSDETAYLLQTRTQQQKSAEVEDCFVSGGCVTTTTTTPPETCGTFTCKDGYVTRTVFKGQLGEKPCGALCSNLKCCMKEINTCQDWCDENEECGAGSGWSFPTRRKLLQCGLSGCSKDRCCTKDTTTTTAAPTTTTTAAPTTTTTTAAPTTPAPTRPSYGENKIKPPPPPRPGKVTTGDPEEDPTDYCVRENYLDVSRMTVNNLGGMGPDFGKQELRYAGVTKVNGEAVDLVITDAGGNYKSANMVYNFRRKLFGHTGQSFIGKYNGNRYRQDVMAIGSLAKGSFKFKFSFEKRDGSPVVVPRVAFTLYDLDGEEVQVRGGGTKSYEELETYDACIMEADEHSDVSAKCDEPKMVMGKKVRNCHAESARQEIAIPANFDNPDENAKKASVTLMYSQKSHFYMTYRLNYPHRVFLFKGQCID